MIAIKLPFPGKDLSPNSRGHWSQKSKANQYHRTFGMAQAKNKIHGQKFPDPPYYVTYLFYPPDRHHYDVDNLVARMKSGQDGVFLAAGVDDQTVKRVTGEMMEVREGGAVIVLIHSFVPVVYGVNLEVLLDEEYN